MSTLGELMGVEAASEDELYAAMDWLLERQENIERGLAPILFDDEDKALAEGLRDSVVAPAHRSLKAQSKAKKKRTEDNLPVHSFQTLLADLATIVKNRVQPNLPGESLTFDKITCPTSLQQKAFDLLQVSYLM